MKKSRAKTLKVLFYLGAFTFLLSISACQESDSDVVKPKTIAEIINQSNDFTFLQEIIASGKMGDALRTENLTLFAPNDAAFRASGIPSASVITALSADSVVSFINYHLVNKRYEYADIPSGNLKALNGYNIRVTKQDTIVILNKADVSLKNVNAANGIVHVIDRVLTDK
ncbi:putative surface protein with fasciclin (FAS1) repeats [Dyadobacter jejuensis]|uniref:Putative surface protein with fasciclin (FAS1) repeats n=1 Tax=Dyadobacter jejuensis TaxID=1082580 RepID=A0A316ALG1_9BACT|nr:fasciclin domain-containing protein [Dyadobacter jejuensis]PWJ57680.1 putative surface protein with fasciclin (FAS1) repeats [Dyadobacter jejuensis]